MRILVASAFSTDSSFAHAVNTIKMADGFAKLGHHVTVVARRPHSGPIAEDELRDKFGLAPSLRIVQCNSRLLGRKLNAHTHFALQVVRVALKYRPEFAYCRNYIAPIWLSRLGIPVCAESHNFAERRQRSQLKMIAEARRQRYFRSIVTIAPKLAQRFKEFGVPESKLLVLPDAVDLDLFVPESDRRRERD